MNAPPPPPPPSSSNRFPLLDDLALEPFLYGCHYSTPGYCAFWLLRQQPQLALRLQGGKFDAPDRLFLSLRGAWASATSAPTDVKELVPQFFWRDPSLYLCPAPPPGGGGAGGGSSSPCSSSLSRSDSSPQNAPFGVRSDGRPVGDVELPPWAWRAAENAAKAAAAAAGAGAASATTAAAPAAVSAAAAAAATADAFSAALESDAVASALPLWVDLIFGFKSGRGAEALEADNVFHPMTYGEVARAALAEVERDGEREEGEGSDPRSDPARRRRAAEALRVQAAEFGRCPEVLFDRPHPRVSAFPRARRRKQEKRDSGLPTLQEEDEDEDEEEEEEEREEKKSKRSWVRTLRLDRLRRGIKPSNKPSAATAEKAAAAAAATEVVSASSPSFDAEEQAAVAAAARLEAAAKLASHALGDIEEEEEQESG